MQMLPLSVFGSEQPGCPAKLSPYKFCGQTLPAPTGGGGRLLLKLSLLGEVALSALQEQTTATTEFRVSLLFLGSLLSELKMYFEQGLGGC